MRAPAALLVSLLCVLASARMSPRQLRESSRAADSAPGCPAPRVSSDHPVTQRLRRAKAPEILVSPRPHRSLTQEIPISSRPRRSVNPDILVSPRPRRTKTPEISVISQAYRSLTHETPISSRPRRSVTHEILVTPRPRRTKTPEIPVSPQKHRSATPETVKIPRPRRPTTPKNLMLRRLRRLEPDESAVTPRDHHTQHSRQPWSTRNCTAVLTSVARRAGRARRVSTAGRARRANLASYLFGCTLVTTRLGRLSPEEFKKWYQREILQDDDDDLFGTRTTSTRPQPLLGADSSSTQWQSPPRVSDYYEPYWNNGSHVFEMIKKGEELGKNKHGKFVGWTAAFAHLLSSSEEEVFSSLSTRRLCHPHCTTIYYDYGKVCAFRLAIQKGAWRYVYNTFLNICELEYTNCAYYYWEWKVMHRGDCHSHSMWETFNIEGTYAWSLTEKRETFDQEQEVSGAPAASRAAYWMSATFKLIDFPIYKGSPPF